MRWPGTLSIADGPREHRGKHARYIPTAPYPCMHRARLRPIPTRYTPPITRPPSPALAIAIVRLPLMQASRRPVPAGLPSSSVCSTPRPLGWRLRPSPWPRASGSSRAQSPSSCCPRSCVRSYVAASRAAGERPCGGGGDGVLASPHLVAREVGTAGLAAAASGRADLPAAASDGPAVVGASVRASGAAGGFAVSRRRSRSRSFHSS